MPLRAILFDMDGLMVNTEPLYWDVAKKVAIQHGTVCTDATLRRMMGRSRHESMRIYREACGITAATVDELLAQREEMMLERYATGVDPMPGLREILAKFAGVLEMAVVTSSPKKFTDVLLPALRIRDCFKVVQTGDGITNGKPDPEIYLKAISQLGTIAPGECVVLEDSHAGALAGHRAGTSVLAVPSELTAGEDFSFADGRVTNLFEAADWIARRVAAA